MHLLAAAAGTIGDGGEAIDIDQCPGDMVILSAADSDLTCLVRAQSQMSEGTPILRLANLMQLNHNLSVDLYCEKIISKARLVIIRIIGGVSYWSYGLEQVRSIAKEYNVQLIIIPGDDKPDPHLISYSTVAPDIVNKCWSYFLNGGIENASNLLKFSASLIGYRLTWKEPSPLLKAGVYLPGKEYPSLADVQRNWVGDHAVVLITFYRSLIMSGNLKPIDSLINRFLSLDINVLPIYVSSLKDDFSAELIKSVIGKIKISAIVNSTGFAVSKLGAETNMGPFENTDCPIFQIIFSGMDKESWENSANGLTSRDIAMNVALPEVDGRLITRAVSFKSSAEFDRLTQCSVITYDPVPDRLSQTVETVTNWVKLGSTPEKEKRVAIILSNYPNKDGRIGNGVGLDTPESAFRILEALKSHNYLVENMPQDSQELIFKLKDGPTNNIKKPRSSSFAPSISISAYRNFFCRLPEKSKKEITNRWGEPEVDPFVVGEKFILPITKLGNVIVGVQPARGYNIAPKETYHDPALVPPHGYMAFYAWIRECFKCHGIIHLGKHGNLEWLPGKSVALSRDCYPELALGATPNIYPFIVNDPGEGAQAKRRTAATIIDHLVPPLTRAESYGPMIELEQLIDEYYQASQIDPPRMQVLGTQILELADQHNVFQDCGVSVHEGYDEKLKKLDAYICDVKELQIRDGLHIFGKSPTGDPLNDLLVALVRAPRGGGLKAENSLIRALSMDLGLGNFDPLDCSFSDEWKVDKPKVLLDILPNCLWRSFGDTVERLELVSRELVSGKLKPEKNWQETIAVLEYLDREIRPKVMATGEEEIGGVVKALGGRFILPGPSGAPSRGRPDVLPTGRNFYSVDSRAVPTPTAWQLGWKSAGMLLDRHLQEHGEWPKTIALSGWGTANMRTGGDDIAQAMAFLGVTPEWEPMSGRVIGFNIIPFSALDRPRIDVTFRISGFFRDAFPYQIEFLDSAIRQVAALDEPDEVNPLAATVRIEKRRMMAEGLDEKTAFREASIRIFGSQPGAYGAGLQTLIDEGIWSDLGDFAEAYMLWGSFAYGGKLFGDDREDLFRTRLSKTQVVLHNQDNREHDILDSDDYYQFQGGLSAAVRHYSGLQPAIYHGDHSRPYAPKIRRLEEEIGRVVRGRVVNPKWISGVMRHGYKGAFEMAATVDYLFAFAATSHCVSDHHFDAVYEAYIETRETLEFLKESNPDALNDIIHRLLEARDRGLWRPSRNSITNSLEALLSQEQT